MKKNTIIIGAGSAGSLVVEEAGKYAILNIVGILDDDPDKVGKDIKGTRVIGNIRQLEDKIKELGVELVIIAIPSASGRLIQQVTEYCSNSGIEYKILPGLYEFFSGISGTTQMRPVNVIDILKRPAKRFDIDVIRNFLKDKTALITGAAGSIGSEICRQLLQFDVKNTILLDNNESLLFEIDDELDKNFPDKKKTYVLGDIKDYSFLDMVFKKYMPEIVFHAAAYKHVTMLEKNKIQAIRNNIIPTEYIMECSEKYHVKNFVMISTDKAVNPTSIMGASKRICEMIVLSSQAKYTEKVVVRFGNVFGSSSSLIPIVTKQLEAGGPITITDPRVTRFFMSIPEAAKLVIQASALGKNNDILILNMGEPYKIADIVKEIVRLRGKELGKDIHTKYIGLRPGEKLSEELFTKEEDVTTTGNDNILNVRNKETIDIEKLRLHLDELKKIDDDKKIVEKIKNILPNFQHD